MDNLQRILINQGRYVADGIISANHNVVDAKIIADAIRAHYESGGFMFNDEKMPLFFAVGNTFDALWDSKVIEPTQELAEDIFSEFFTQEEALASIEKSMKDAGVDEIDIITKMIEFKSELDSD